MKIFEIENVSEQRANGVIDTLEYLYPRGGDGLETTGGLTNDPRNLL